MFIQSEATPNPATLKFIPGRMMLDSGTMEFSSPESAARYPQSTLGIFRLSNMVFDIWLIDYWTKPK